MRRCHKSSLLILSYGSLGLLLLLLVGLLLPACKEEALASVLNTSATTDVNTTIVPSISIALDSKVDLVVDQFDQIITSSSPLTVTTNSREGYSLYLSTTGEDNSLHGQNKDNEAVISPIAKDTTSSSFASNSWGYRLSRASEDNLYQPVPTTPDAVADSTTVGNSTTEYNLTFATKIDESLPTDTYYNSVLVSAVANPVTVTSLNELLYMQDMTPAICSNTMDYVDKEHYIEKRVIDIRDGKSYWVAKLADGNCWMVQNLGLNLGTADAATEAKLGKFVQTLTPNDSDVAANYTSPSNTETTVPTFDSSVNATTKRSWNLGTYFLSDPNVDTNCNDIPAGKTLADCPTRFEAYDESTDGDGEKTHYLAGNYYTYSLATVGTADGSVAKAPNSICPKNWRLPANTQSGWGNNETVKIDKDGDIYKLLLAYGFTDAYYASSAGNAVLNFNTAANPITLEPLHFMRSGYIAPATTETLQQAGREGVVILSTADSAWRFLFRIFANHIYPAETGSANQGFSVRCLAR